MKNTFVNCVNCVCVSILLYYFCHLSSVFVSYGLIGIIRMCRRSHRFIRLYFKNWKDIHLMRLESVWPSKKKMLCLLNGNCKNGIFMEIVCLQWSNSTHPLHSCKIHTKKWIILVFFFYWNSIISTVHIPHSTHTHKTYQFGRRFNQKDEYRHHFVIPFVVVVVLPHSPLSLSNGIVCRLCRMSYIWIGWMLHMQISLSFEGKRDRDSEREIESTSSHHTIDSTHSVRFPVAVCFTQWLRIPF